MHKPFLPMAITALCGALLFSAGALAAQPATHPGSTDTQPATQPATTGKAHVKATRAVPAPGSRDCIRSTGSLIPAPKGQCLPVAGRSYSHQDIQRTGQTDISRALQQLDPSVSLGGH